MFHPYDHEFFSRAEPSRPQADVCLIDNKTLGPNIPGICDAQKEMENVIVRSTNDLLTTRVMHAMTATGK